MKANKNTSRLLGAAFLIVLALSFISGELVGSLGLSIVGLPDNISEIMINISDNPTLMRMSILGFLIEAVAIVLLTTLLFTTLKTHNKILARLAFGLWIIEAVTIVVREASAFALLYTSQEYVTAGAPDSSYFQTLGSLFYESTQFIYASQMIFYTIGGVLFYYLFFKSKYIPKALSLFGIIAASLGFIGELFVFFGYDVPLYVFLPILPFEIAIGVWLIIKGFNSSAIDSPSAKTVIN